MVKVQNGWESNTLSEIESLTSQHGSPKSSVTETSFGSKQPPLQSPRTAMSATLRRQRSSSMSSQGASAISGGLHVDGPSQRNKTYQQKAIDGFQRRALEPPADIVPGPRRRPHHANAPPTGYRSVNPQRPTGPKQRTASQNAAMEADAVETLLFMASPGNSGNQPSSSGGMASTWMSAPTSSQTSPLKSEFSSQELLPSPQRHVAFANVSKPIPAPVDLSSQFKDIDRMIDEMDDSSTESGYIEDLTARQRSLDHAVPT
jgi:hypothetical protein